MNYDDADVTWTDGYEPMDPAELDAALEKVWPGWTAELAAQARYEQVAAYRHDYAVFSAWEPSQN